MEGFPWDDHRKLLPGCCQVTNVLHGAETLRKISIDWVGCTNVTDDRRQTDGRRHIANMNMSSRSLKIVCNFMTSIGVPACDRRRGLGSVQAHLSARVGSTRVHSLSRNIVKSLSTVDTHNNRLSRNIRHSCYSTMFILGSLESA